jgi:maltose alpha-D-glucosyltransferase/alpha-amylase
MRFYQLDKKGQIISDNSYFKLESDADISGFLKDFPYEEWKDLGLRCLITGNHDTKRCSFNLNDAERRLAYAFIFTMPGAPFLYYGDEIGMAYRWLPTKEGGYHRTGSRSPMQWTEGKNLGFSEGKAEDLYLPVDPNPNGSTVESQEADPNSMLHHVRKLIALRQGHEDLGNYSPFAVYQIGKRLFGYKRGDYLVAVNPGKDAEMLELDGKYEAIFTMGKVSMEAKSAKLESQSFVVLKPVE